MVGGKKFTAVLGSEEHGGLFFEVPFDVKAVFGRARPPVCVTVNGYAFRTTVSVYGGCSYVGVRRSHREAAGVAVGDRVRVTMALDEAPRVVSAPAELTAALKKDAAAKAAWSELSYSHKKEWADAIRDAKRPETRARRVDKALASLQARAQGMFFAPGTCPPRWQVSGRPGGARISPVNSCEERTSTKSAAFFEEASCTCGRNDRIEKSGSLARYDAGFGFGTSCVRSLDSASHFFRPPSIKRTSACP